MSVCPDSRARVRGGEEIWLAAWRESLMKIQQICTSISDPGAIHYSTSHVNRSKLKFQYIGSDLYSRIKWLQIHNLARQNSGSRSSLSPSSAWRRNTVSVWRCVFQPWTDRSTHTYMSGLVDLFGRILWIVGKLNDKKWSLSWRFDEKAKCADRQKAAPPARIPPPTDNQCCPEELQASCRWESFLGNS